jgi:hypothetical protein
MRPRQSGLISRSAQALHLDGPSVHRRSMASSAVPPEEAAVTVTSDAGAALPSACGALQHPVQHCSMPNTYEPPAASTFALEALPPDVTRRILGALACLERPGAPQRLRALQPATLTCRAWRAAARQLVCQLTFKGGRAEAYKGRDLSAFPQLSRLVFEREIRAGDAAQLLLTLPAPHDPALSAAARTVSGGGSEAHNDRTDGALSQQHRASASGGSCCGGSRGGLRDISGGASHRTGSALHVCGLPLPLPAALTSLTRLDVSLLAPPPPDDCTLGPAQWRAHAPGRRLAAALDALPLLIHLRVRDAPPACAELAEALPRAARLRELVVAREGGLINYPAGECVDRVWVCRGRACVERGDYCTGCREGCCWAAGLCTRGRQCGERCAGGVGRGQGLTERRHAARVSRTVFWGSFLTLCFAAAKGLLRVFGGTVWAAKGIARSELIGVVGALCVKAKCGGATSPHRSCIRP